jgi:hypothetical protein
MGCWTVNKEFNQWRNYRKQPKSGIVSHTWAGVFDHAGFLFSDWRVNELGDLAFARIANGGWSDGRIRNCIWMLIEASVMLSKFARKLGIHTTSRWIVCRKISHGWYKSIEGTRTGGYVEDNCACLQNRRLCLGMQGSIWLDVDLGLLGVRGRRGSSKNMLLRISYLNEGIAGGFIGFHFVAMEKVRMQRWGIMGLGKRPSLTKGKEAVTERTGTAEPSIS